MTRAASPGEASLPRVREARDGDAAGLIHLIGSCFAEYPNCVLDVDGEIPELRAIATYFAEHAGRFWVAEREGQVVGCVGVTPAANPAGVELKKLYVLAAERRSRLGSRLTDLAEEEGRRRRATFVDLWSDTRFETAHRFYEGRGYVRTGATRELHDLSDTVEFHFRKEL